MIKRFSIPTTMILMLFIVIGCAGTGPRQEQEVHRMSRYVPNASANPAGVPRQDVDVEEASLSETPVTTGATSGHGQLSPGEEVKTSLRGIPKPEDIRNVIDNTGHITLPLIGQVPVAGLSASQAERLIESSYVDGGYYRNINVIVVSEDKSYFVQGEVNQQGRYRMSGKITLLKAITEAGGYTPFANRRNVKIIRGDEVLQFNARNIARGRDPDPEIQANDIIEVLRRGL